MPGCDAALVVASKAPSCRLQTQQLPTDAQTGSDMCSAMLHVTEHVATQIPWL